jgi:hypothetical protein
MSETAPDEDWNRPTPWADLPASWHCPCCDRDKRAIVMWCSRRGDKSGAEYKRIRHRDHGTPERFPRTIICLACHRAHNQALVMCGAPNGFTFSIEEMKQFIKPDTRAEFVVVASKAIAAFRGDTSGYRRPARSSSAPYKTPPEPEDWERFIIEPNASDDFKDWMAPEGWKAPQSRPQHRGRKVPIEGEPDAQLQVYYKDSEWRWLIIGQGGKSEHSERGFQTREHAMADAFRPYEPAELENEY